MTPLPSAHQIRQISPHLKEYVPDSYTDANEHMNVRHYFDLQIRGLDAMFADVGIEVANPDKQGFGLFAMEHHLRYFAEVLPCQEVSVHVRLLDHNERFGHAMCFLLNNTTGELANTLEVIFCSVELTTRRPTTISASIAAGFLRALEISASLDWAAPICGSIGIRRH